MDWAEFFSILEKSGMFSIPEGVDFSFRGGFGNITEFGKTTSIEGYYHSPKNFYFDLHRDGEGNTSQTQITSSEKNKYTSEKLFIKMIFSNIEIS